MDLASRTIAVGGAKRTYLLAEPAGPATAVVLCLHGSRSSARRQALYSDMARLAGSGAAAVVFPEAVARAGSGYRWDADGDVPYLAQLVDELRDRYPTPAGRVCLTGLSGGARMACHFAALHAEAVSMVGAVAGLRAPDAPALARPVPILAFHGTADRINPYDGSGTARWDESVPDAARSWASANGLAESPAADEVPPHLTRTTYGRADGEGEVTLWTARGAGHTWPGARSGLFLRLILGRVTSEIDATAEIWAFAGRHAADR